jgi:hypothetical protein
LLNLHCRFMQIFSCFHLMRKLSRDESYSILHFFSFVFYKLSLKDNLKIAFGSGMEELIAHINYVLDNKETQKVSQIGHAVQIGQYHSQMNRQSITIPGKEKKLSFRENELLKPGEIDSQKRYFNHVMGNWFFFLFQKSGHLHQQSWWLFTRGPIC